VAEGTAYWAKEGNGLVTYMYDVFETGLFESFFILFGAEQPVDAPVVNMSGIQIYPNPTSGLLNISENLKNVAIYDVVGRKVYVQSEAETTIDLSDLAVGQYILVAEAEGQLISTKIVIKK
jgi:hypothetical protein